MFFLFFQSSSLLIFFFLHKDAQREKKTFFILSHFFFFSGTFLFCLMFFLLREKTFFFSFCLIFFFFSGLSDKCALKYKLMAQFFLFMQRSEMPSRRPTRMSWSEMAWALHSESHPTLVDQLMSSVEWNWKNVKAFGKLLSFYSVQISLFLRFLVVWCRNAFA